MHLLAWFVQNPYRMLTNKAGISYLSEWLITECMAVISRDWVDRRPKKAELGPSDTLTQTPTKHPKAQWNSPMRDHFLLVCLFHTSLALVPPWRASEAPPSWNGRPSQWQTCPKKAHAEHEDVASCAGDMVRGMRTQHFKHMQVKQSHPSGAWHVRPASF